MRCTTELTARFALNMNLIGSKELDAFLNNDDMPGSIEYWEAFDRAEEARLNGEAGLLDALDFTTVPFESADEELSLELYAQDAAEERENDADYCTCEKCGFAENWEDGPLIFIAGKHYCNTCKPADVRIVALQELYAKREARARSFRIKKADKFRAALALAMKLHPEMNWAKYEHDARAYA